jgi:hypothetical protein
MKKVDHRERIYTCNNEMEELENQLMGEITSEDAKVTLTAMTTLRKQAKQTFDKIVSDHGVLQEPRRFPSRGKVSDKSKKTERHVDFILPTPEPASSSSDSSTDDEDNPPALSTSDLIESGQLVIDPALLAQIDVEGLEVEEAPWSESSEVTLGAENPEAAEEGGDTQEEGAGDTEEEGEDTEPEDSEDTKEKDEDTEPEDSGEDSGDSEDTEDSGNTGDNEEEMSDSEPEDTGNTKEEGGDTNPEDSGEDSGNSEDTEDSGNAGGTEEMTNLKGTEEEMAEPKNTEGKVVEPVNTIDIAKAVIRTAIKRKNEDFENYKHLPPKKRYTRRQ